MPWQVRHAGSPRVVRDLSLQQIVDGLQDGQWETTDEVLGPGEERWRTIDAHPQLADIAQDVEAPPQARQLGPKVPAGDIGPKTILTSTRCPVMTQTAP